MKRKIGYDYFLSDIGNQAIISVTVFFATVNLIYCFPGLGDLLNNFSIVAQTLAFFGLPTLFSILVLLFVNKPKKEDDGVTVYNNKDLDRNKRWQSLKEHSGLYVLTGESGSGKTHLLNSLFQEGSDCHIISNNYFLNWNEESDFQGKHYIILDQFENALPFFDENKKKIIDNLLHNGCLVILSLKQEAYGDVCRIFEGRINNSSESGNVSWLFFNKEERDILVNQLNDIFDSEIEQYELFKDMVNDIENNSITFIQYSFIIKAVKKYDAYEANNKYKKLYNNYDLLISSYLEDIICSYSNSRLAYQILYLLCLDNKAIYTATRSDFRNISFESQTEIDKTIKFLSENELIRLHRSTDSGHPNIEKFEITHDYIFEIIKNICNENVPVDFRKNIEYYHSNIQIKRTQKTSDKLKEANYICEAFSGQHIGEKKSAGIKKSLRFEDVTLIVLLIIIAAINVIYIRYYSLLPDDNSFLRFMDSIRISKLSISKGEFHLLLAFINLVVGMSIYYIYNYYKHFLRIFRYKPLVVEQRGRWNKDPVITEMFGFTRVVNTVVLIGCVGCCFAFLVPDFWAVGIGVEILFTGLLTFLIIKRARSSERSSFFNNGINNCTSGLVVIGLGFLYRVYLSISFPLAIPFFLLYAMFILLCIRNHINRQYTLSLVGKILFNAEIYRKH